MTGDTCLDIPKGLEGLSRYRATLANKACHSFAPNAAFTELHHPRFGDIMSIVAKRDIDRGEEVLVSYNYAIHQARIPPHEGNIPYSSYFLIKVYKKTAE